MRKNWLRGVVLGLSLALLLAGGVALAQNGLSLTAEPYCFQCEADETDLPPPGYYTTLTLSGHPTNGPLDVQPAVSLYEMCVQWIFGGEVPDYLLCEGDPPEEDPAVAYLQAFCPGDEPNPGWRFLLNTGQGWEPGPWWHYGEWTLRVWVEENIEPEVSAGEIVAGPAEAVFRVAEDCAEFEFVPEPGTIALLGSGLVGLAGYAALRWRTRA